jgi:hypothetical protein
LQILFGLLVVVIAQLADAVFELKIAQIFLDRGLALIEMLERRDGLRRGKILGTNAQDERDDDDRDEAGEGYDHV